MMQVKADGSLEIPAEIHAQISSDKFFEGRVVLVARLLGLMVLFIGENLTLRLVREAWPQIPADFDLNKGGKNEKSK